MSSELRDSSSDSSASIAASDCAKQRDTTMLGGSKLLSDDLLRAGFTLVSDGIFAFTPHGIVVETMIGNPLVVTVDGRSDDMVAAFAKDFIAHRGVSGFGDALISWAKQGHAATPQVPRAGCAIFELGSENDCSANGSSDEEGSCSEHASGFDPLALPAPAELGVDAGRRIRILTFGKHRLKKFPSELMQVQAHITCNIKKFHYLTRNNKHLTKLSGLHDEVQGQICRCGFFASWIGDVVKRIEQNNLTSLALNCFKGTHRSVAAAEILKKAYYPLADVKHLTLGYIRPGRPGGPARR